jgi:protoheme IX farnesyltransferase
MGVKIPVSEIAVEPLSVSHRGLFAALSDLFKARLTSLVLVTTAVGFAMGSRGSMDLMTGLITLIGTGFLAAGAAALNQFLEKDLDARMSRTCKRPIPSGEIAPKVALVIGAVISMCGLAVLSLGANPLAGVLGVLTLVIYLFVYTPLKQVTSLNTLVGAVPGAMPPLIGWVAAAGEISPAAWSLFTLMFFWQIPHFMAIAWMYREDYAKAGYVMEPAKDSTGRSTGHAAVRHAVASLAFSLAPYSMGISGMGYLLTALIVGGAYLFAAWRFASGMNFKVAKQLFLVSILHLPILLGVLVLDKVDHLHGETTSRMQSVK